MSGPSGNRAEQALRRRFQAEEQQGIEAFARWLGHLAVRSVIGERRASAEQAVAPIGRLLSDQTAVMFFCLHLFGLTGVEPDWQIRRPPICMLTADELKAIEQVKADFRAILQLTANELKEAGAGVVPSWAGDLVAVGKLLLLDVDWALPARELAEALQPPAIGAIHVDASGTTHRRGSGERANNNIGALRRDFERHLRGPPPRAPYAAAVREPCPSRPAVDGRRWPRSANGGRVSVLRRSLRRSVTTECSAAAWPGLRAATCASCSNRTPDRRKSCAVPRRAPSTRTSKR